MSVCWENKDQGCLFKSLSEHAPLCNALWEYWWNHLTYCKAVKLLMYATWYSVQRGCGWMALQWRLNSSSNLQKKRDSSTTGGGRKTLRHEASTSLLIGDTYNQKHKIHFEIHIFNAFFFCKTHQNAPLLYEKNKRFKRKSSMKGRLWTRMNYLMSRKNKFFIKLIF